ncbi:hypothetical protein JCM8208_000706 [Rhodotorula glutinis]
MPADASRPPPAVPSPPHRRSRPLPAAGSPSFRFPAPHPYNANASPTSHDSLLLGLAHRASYPAASSQEALLEKPVVGYHPVERLDPPKKSLDPCSSSPTPPRPARPPASLFSRSGRALEPGLAGTIIDTSSGSSSFSVARAACRPPAPSAGSIAVGPPSSSAQTSHEVVELYELVGNTVNKKKSAEQALPVVTIDVPQRSSTRSRASVGVASSTRRRKSLKKRAVVVVIVLVVAAAIAVGVGVAVRRNRAAQERGQGEERTDPATSARAEGTAPTSPSSSSAASTGDAVQTQLDSSFPVVLATKGPSATTTFSTASADARSTDSTSSSTRIATRARAATASRTAAESSAPSSPFSRSTSRPRPSPSSIGITTRSSRLLDRVEALRRRARAAPKLEGTVGAGSSGSERAAASSSAAA